MQARNEGEEPPHLATSDALDWQALVPAVPRPPQLTPAQAKQLAELMQEAVVLSASPIKDHPAAVAKCEEVLAIDPRHKLALWRKADWLCEPAPAEVGYVWFIAYARQVPAFFLPILFRFYEDSVKNFLIMVEMPKDHWKRTGDLTLDMRGLRLMLQLMNLLYPDEEKPRWVPPERVIPPAQILAEAGQLLREDPSMIWLFSLTAHVRQLTGDIDGAKRDLNLYLDLVRNDTEHNDKDVAVVANLHRAWIIGESDPKLALDGLIKIPREALEEKTSRQVIMWLENDPRMEKVRQLPGVRAFKSNLGEGKH